jgi:hypothetical protein
MGGADRASPGVGATKAKSPRPNALAVSSAAVPSAAHLAEARTGGGDVSGGARVSALA